ncbi:large ribosomal subunit protein mL54 [Anopheles ziemanni]|uniref:large ribosomal subunit protein mL54 n=1 Tax=Anopheles coustani TaxID=139045 RepID=UPI00265A0FD9|nr:large ribosomal subunit protein mL54 [Anopheles coustani]XP_058166561.1 large ribosomal subunit protein mL54 [Anopheles ziemanni]
MSNLIASLVPLMRRSFIQITSVRNYATPKAGGALGGSKKKKLGKLGPVVEKKVIPVETDANKLVSFVCGSNIMKQGEDIKLKPDSEYPEWLWTMHVGAPLTLEEMDPNTKAYWRKLRRMALQRSNKLAKLKKF